MFHDPRKEILISSNTLNTFEALVKIGTGLLLLNLTIRRVDLKNIVLIVSAGFQVIILFKSQGCRKVSNIGEAPFSQS